MEKTRTSWLWIGLIILMAVGVMAGIDPFSKWMVDTYVIPQNREVIGDQKIIPVEGGPSGPFSLSFEVTSVNTTINGILVVKLQPGYSLVNLDFNPDSNKLLLVYRTPEDFVETASVPINALRYEGIQIISDKIKVLDGQ